MLKKLTPRHRDIIRRLVLGESPSEISAELGITADQVNLLQKDPIFASELHDLERKLIEKMSEKEGAFAKMANAASSAAQLCVDVVKGVVTNADGTKEVVGTGMRVKGAWDILDRTGFAKTSKVAVVDDPAQMLLDAYAKRKAAQAEQSSDKRV